MKVGFFPGVWYRSWVGGEIVEMRLSILCFLVIYDWMIWLIDAGIDWGAAGLMSFFFSLASNGVDCRIVVLCYQSELSVLSRILWDGDYGG